MRSASRKIPGLCIRVGIEPLTSDTGKKDLLSSVVDTLPGLPGAWAQGSAVFSRQGPLIRAARGTLLLMLPIAMLAGYQYHLSVRQYVSALSVSSVQQVGRVGRDVELELAQLLLDMRALVTHPAMTAYVAGQTIDSRLRLQEAMRFFALTRRDYHQVRLLDPQGHEVIRVVFNDGQASEVPASALQSKASRYYFRESIGLAADEIYVSPLDLQVEQGRVEVPARPMLRLAQSVFDKAGNRVGLVVLNYAAQRLVDRLREYEYEYEDGATYRQLLVSDNGYFALAPERTDDWAFMYPEKNDANRFAVRFPEAAHALRLADQAAVRTANGLFAVHRIRYPRRSQRASQPVRHWLLVSWVPQRVLNAERLSIALRMVLITVLIGALVFVVVLLVIVLLDAARAHREAEMQARTRLHAILHTASEGIVTINQAGIIESFNPAAEKIFGRLQGEVLGQALAMLMPKADAVSHAGYLQDYLGSGERQVIGQLRKLRGVRSDGSVFPMELSVSEAMIGGRLIFTAFVRDITLRAQMEADARRQALFDDLTGLPNRRMLLAELSRVIDNARTGGMFGALLVLDLDHFKTISDALGHAAGDQVLRDLAARLRNAMRKEDLVVRLGGDEFAVVLDRLHHDEGQAAGLAYQLAQTVGEALGTPLSIRDVSQSLTASIGVALYPLGDSTADTVLKHADTAMNRAKSSGRNAIRFFRPSMEAEVSLRLQFMADLRNALLRGEFVFHYQPKIDIVAGRIVGIEALIRWQHPERGLLMPDAFIGYAEDVGLIGEIGEWAILQALRDLKKLNKAGVSAPLGHVAVNISAKQFYDSGFLRRLRNILAEADVPASWLELEITESLMLDNVDMALKKMRRLHEMGVTLALDDFGTGFSSLSYVRRLPFDRIKIDRSFISGVENDPAKAAMVETILSLVKVRPVEFVAEGVETVAERDWLRAHGSRVVQGYFYSRPLPFEALKTFVSTFAADVPMETT